MNYTLRRRLSLPVAVEVSSAASVEHNFSSVQAEYHTLLGDVWRGEPRANLLQELSDVGMHDRGLKRLFFSVRGRLYSCPP